MAGTKFLAENISVARDVIKLQYLFRICDVTKSFSEQVLNKPWTYLSPFCSKVTTVASGIPATSFYIANRLVVTGGALPKVRWSMVELLLVPDQAQNTIARKLGR